MRAFLFLRALIQLAECVLWEHEVAGSSPARPTNFGGFVYWLLLGVVVVAFLGVALFEFRQHQKWLEDFCRLSSEEQERLSVLYHS